MYGLYGVVVHDGSLGGGHYTAYVRQRPLKKTLSGQHTVSVDQQTYDVKAAEDGKWYYTSDAHVSPTGFDQVKRCQAYLLFYEMLPVTLYDLYVYIQSRLMIVSHEAKKKQQ